MSLGPPVIPMPLEHDELPTTPGGARDLDSIRPVAPRAPDEVAAVAAVGPADDTPTGPTEDDGPAPAVAIAELDLQAIDELQSPDQISIDPYDPAAQQALVASATAAVPSARAESAFLSSAIDDFADEPSAAEIEVAERAVPWLADEPPGSFWDSLDFRPWVARLEPLTYAVFGLWAVVAFLSYA